MWKSRSRWRSRFILATTLKKAAKSQFCLLCGARDEAKDITKVGTYSDVPNSYLLLVFALLIEPANPKSLLTSACSRD